ncbi:hypothetical protein BDN72DRAFT_893690 [Pluteus cervinus]|uniref:Uncharacterized protein n=1 Tax=Pluteus cervinus TaxID=181527 RepID=A0ACD3B6M9_9AGAR|nr:hypothetical protein BDN72DRAFT_893690 [Pluteus cervinus]
MLNLQDPLVQIGITSAVCSFVAVSSTVHRIYVRWGRLWADDAWAVFSMLSLFCQIAGVFMRVSNPVHLSPLSRVASYYIMAISFYTIIWAARLSILFSIIRLDPDQDQRRRLFWVAGLFTTVCLVLIAQLFWVCEPKPDWKKALSPQCPLDKEVAICQLISDIIADVILILAPLKLLAGLEDKTLRLRLMVIFSTCIVTTIVSLVHAAYILTLGGSKVVIAALVEDCISLIVCNIPVVITASIRLRERTQAKKVTEHSTFMKFASRAMTQKETRFQTTAFSLDELASRVTGKPEVEINSSVFDLVTDKRATGTIREERTSTAKDYFDA